MLHDSVLGLYKHMIDSGIDITDFFLFVYEHFTVWHMV